MENEFRVELAKGLATEVTPGAEVSCQISTHVMLSETATDGLRSIQAPRALG